ncbi:hypothetical protein OESDEN_21462 [Oesophagostomum dentatum]|uniref:Uncharacterized protein n=1 Tax=Oesophagostomum dentatum TaxID=61180 RepID=A0A0B1S1U1_OESDE|nr:hypothetical protein OESDEN_21462 [Oesophagostomum dentatum]
MSAYEQNKHQLKHLQANSNHLDHHQAVDMVVLTKQHQLSHHHRFPVDTVQVVEALAVSRIRAQVDKQQEVKTVAAVTAIGYEWSEGLGRCFECPLGWAANLFTAILGYQ